MKYYTGDYVAFANKNGLPVIKKIVRINRGRKRDFLGFRLEERYSNSLFYKREDICRIYFRPWFNEIRAYFYG